MHGSKLQSENTWKFLKIVLIWCDVMEGRHENIMEHVHGLQ